MLTDELFPVTARAVQGQLEIGGCDVAFLAAEFGTPLYLYDEITLRENARRAVAAFASWRPSTLVLYAAKAFLAPFLARILMEEGLGLDVTSEGEIEVARRAGFSPDGIYLHGNCKTAAEIRVALAAGISHVVVDNLDEIPLLSEIAADLGTRPRVLMRIAPNIDPHTHRYLTTGVAHSKFGLGLANGQAERALLEIRSKSNLELVGLHMHLGSQIFEIEPYVDAIRILLDTARDWRDRYSFRLGELDLGGGWGVGYSQDDSQLSVEDVAVHMLAELRRGLVARELPTDARLLAEPGRSLVARAGVAVYRVGSFKQVSDRRTYASVDGGMGDNIRPTLYGARYSARVVNRFDTPPAKRYAIAGRYCEQGDVLIDNVALPHLAIGDLVAVPGGGAYQLPMASNYNLIPRPPIVLVRDGKARLVRRRETLDDLLRCDQEVQ